MQTAFTSQAVVTPEGIRPAAVIVQDGRITEIREALGDLEAGVRVWDFGSHVILPGLVDTHVHINEPGRTEWEGFETATRAAAAGGFTTLIDMPLNSIPATTSVEGLRAKRAAASAKCAVDYGFWGGLIEGNQDCLAALARERVRGFKCFLAPSGVDEFPMIRAEPLREAMRVVAGTGLPLLVHAELPEFLGEPVPGDGRRYRDYLASRPARAEVAAIRLLIDGARETGCRVHVVHLATGEALPLLRAARAEGLPVTVETCPHYLHFASEDIADGRTLMKCAPPIRSRENRELLWEALRAGDIDLVVTDHSPCPPAMKRMEDGDFFGAWGGIASLSVALPVMWTEARRRGFGLADIARWMSERPAELAGLAGVKGRIAVGCDADVVVFDPDATFVVEPERLHYRHPVSAYMGETLYGVVRQTFVRGDLPAQGREVR